MMSSSVARSFSMPSTPPPCTHTLLFLSFFQAALNGPSTDRLYRTNLAEVESGKKERLEDLRLQTVLKYKEAEEAGKGEFRLHETRNTLDALRDEVWTLLNNCSGGSWREVRLARTKSRGRNAKRAGRIGE